MSDKEYLSAKVDSDSALYKRFQAVKEQDGYESNSEAVRALVRAGIAARESSGGPLASWLNFAEENIPAQVNAFGVMMIFAGAMLTFFNIGTPGGPIWLIAAGFFGFVALTNLFGILSPIATKFVPGTDAADPSSNTDEVEA